MNKENIHFDEIFKLLKKGLENFTTPVLSKKKVENVIHSPYTTLISCLLSLRTKDEVTEQASIRLLSKYDTPQKIVKLPITKIQELIYPVGFYKTKSERIVGISKILIEKYNGNVPETIDDLLKLKGVGRKTANIVMVYGHKKNGFLPIDTHCHRIPNRLGWIKTKNPEQTEEELRRILPKKYWVEFNHLFVKFGQTICVPISPFCSKCPINKYCKKISVKRSR
jgi:endonuclease-3